MQLTRWRPRYGFGNQNTLFPVLMDDFFAPLGTRSSTTQNEFLPPVDIYEKEEKVFFEAELPGFNKEDLKVGVQGKIITLSGERQMETGEENRFRKERRYGRFERSFQLGFEADGNMIEAKYENGVLTVIVSRPEEIKAKQIEIH